MKVYTLVNVFNIAGNVTYDECWIAHYENKNDAVRALELLLEKRLQKSEDMNVEKLFDTMLTTGCSEHIVNGDQDDFYFVRKEEVNDKFDVNQLP